MARTGKINYNSNSNCMDFEKIKEEHKKLIDSHGGYNAVKKRLLEQTVYAHLYFGAKRDSESIEFATGDLKLDWMYHVDLYTRTGIVRLGIPPHSCFEIKERLVGDSVFRISEFAKTYRQRYPEAKIYLLYQDKGMLSEKVEREVKKQKQIELFQVNTFLGRIKTTAKINDRIDRVEQDWKSCRDRFIDDARYAYIENHCTFFLGAGVSMDAGGPSWKELLEKILKRFKRIGKRTDFDRVYDACGFSPIILGRYATSTEKGLDNISDYLQRYVLYRNVNPDNSELINAICEAVIGPPKDEHICAVGGLDSIITYNYDDMVETALKKKGVSAARIYLKSRSRKDEFPVYHVHGLIPQEDHGIVSSLILSEREYHEVYKESFNWSNIEQLHALDRNTCFFIGMSMTDPNLRRLLDISRTGSDKESRHFAFLKREDLFKPEEVEKNESHFNTIESQLNELGVQVIWYKNHNEVPEMLRKIISSSSYVG